MLFGMVLDVHGTCNFDKFVYTGIERAGMVGEEIDEIMNQVHDSMKESR
jgi:hypothetical protein